jgi:hypothetical protein
MCYNGLAMVRIPKGMHYRLCCAVGFFIFSTSSFIDSNLSLVGLVDILLFRNYNERNSRLVLALILSCSYHTRKRIDKRLSA